MQNYKAELEQMREELAQAKFGSFLIIPLKYDTGDVNIGWLNEIGKKQPITTMDINEAIKQNLNADNGIQILERYYISGKKVQELLFDNVCADEVKMYVCEADATPDMNDIPQNSFRIHSAYFYIFHTQVAFLCLGITYSKIETVEKICNLGFSESHARYMYQNASQLQPFSLDEKMIMLCKMAGLKCFFRDGSALSLESYIYMLAVVRNRFQYLESLRHLTFNLHQMIPLGEIMEDESEGDIRYVFSVKSRALGTYRWGCCVTSQTISYIVADEDLDVNAEMLAHAEDCLPIILLALYEKYSCLRFTQLLSSVNIKSMRRLRKLNRQMLEFRAYGTVDPSHISRWYNIKQIYQHMIETNGINTAIEDVSNKLGILAERQKEMESNTSEAVMGLITIFGLVSILDSLLSIKQIIVGGDPLALPITVISPLLIIIGIIVTVLWRRRE